MREDNCTIRLAERGDGALLSALFTQLGYPTPGEEVDGRLGEPDPAREVLVAERHGNMVGVLIWHRLQPMHLAPAWGLISALVIDEGARSGGIGAPPPAGGEKPRRGRWPRAAVSWSSPAA